MKSQSSQPSSVKKAMFIVVLLLMVPVLLLFAELCARLVIAVNAGAWDKSYGLYVADPEIGHIPAGNSYNHLTTLNAEGFRNFEDLKSPKPSHALRIITYGGSTTFSYNLPTEKSWPYLLQSILREKRKNSDDQVLNAGVVLWSIGHAFALAKRQIPSMKPNYVIIYSGINEEANAAYLEYDEKETLSIAQNGKYGTIARNYPASNWLHMKSVIFKILDKIFKRLMSYTKLTILDNPSNLPFQKRLAETVPAGFIPSDPDPYILQNYQGVLRQFIKLIQHYGGIPVFIIQSTSENGTKIDRYVRYSSDSSELARQLGARVLDSREILTAYDGLKTDLFTSSGIHYSALGSQMLASLIYNEVFALKIELDRE